MTAACVMNSTSIPFDSNASDKESQTSRAREWKPTILRIGPLSGIFAVFLAILTLVIDAAVLIGSDGAPVNNWSAGPSIYLAICTAIANLAMRYACLHGVIITWWNRALRGSTLEKLHQDWKAGSSLYGAIASGKKIGLLGTATIFSTIVIIDGPLLQRSTTVRSAPIHDQPVSLKMSISPELPRGFSGAWSTGRDNGLRSFNSAAFNKTIPAPNGGSVPNDIWVDSQNNLDLDRLWAAQDPLPGAPALAKTACTQYNIPVDFKNAGPPPDSPVAPPLDQQAFMVTINLVVADESEKINLVTGYSTSKHCVGTLYLTACTLESAIGEYEVSIANNKTTLRVVYRPTNEPDWLVCWLVRK